VGVLKSLLVYFGSGGNFCECFEQIKWLKMLEITLNGFFEILC
jgi:hypothetical protein